MNSPETGRQGGGATYRRVAASNCPDLYSGSDVISDARPSRRRLPAGLTNRGRVSSSPGDVERAMCHVYAVHFVVHFVASHFVASERSERASERAMGRALARLTKWIAGSAISHEFRGAFVPVFLTAFRVTYRY